MNGRLGAALRGARRGDQRPLARVPATVRVALLLTVLAQCAWHAWRPPPQARVAELPPPPAEPVARALVLGEPVAAARLAVLWLQSFDDPPGVTVPLAGLDYKRLEAWLDLLLALDPGGQVPLLLASRVYASVPDEGRQRQMLALVARHFAADPAGRWRWMAHAALVARHRLQDLPLALDYARAINRLSRPGQVPFWARDLELLVLQDMCELEAARVLVGGLLDSGAIEDDAELAFLQARLAELEAGSDCQPAAGQP